MIDMISTLIEKGYAYEAKDGTVYFRTKKFKDYGKLSHKNLEDLEAGLREIKVTGEEQQGGSGWTSSCGSRRRRESPTGSPPGARAVPAGTLSAP